MADQRQADQVFVYVEHDQGDVVRQADQAFAYVEHDQGQVQRQLDQIFVYIEWVPLTAPEGRVYGPALAVMGM